MAKNPKPRGRRLEPGRDLTTADLVVLSLLEERPMHGYDLLAEYQRQEVVDWAAVSKAQLYYSLKKLSGLGLIEGRSEEEGAREKTVYRPTIAGRQALAEALANPNWAQTRLAQPFSTWLGLSIHAPASAVDELLAAREAFLLTEIEKERASLKFMQGLSSARVEKGIEIVSLVVRQLEVELEWVAELRRKRRGS